MVVVPYFSGKTIPETYSLINDIGQNDLLICLYSSKQLILKSLFYVQ